MTKNNQDLGYNLWSIFEKLKIKTDLNTFKNYYLALIFYKYLSEKTEAFFKNELKEDNLTFNQAYKIGHMRENLRKIAIENLGYFIEPNQLFSNIVKEAKNKKLALDDLNYTLTGISDSSKGCESENKFIGIFDDIDFNSAILGQNDDDRIKLVSKILLPLSEIDFNLDNEDNNILGDAFEYLISQFSLAIGKEADEFYTPPQISKLLAKIISVNNIKLSNIYDPDCGSASLILRAIKEIDVESFYGEEANISIFNLARMNIIIHNLDFDIKNENSLEYPTHSDMKFEAIVSNPPFSATWSANPSHINDPRFTDYGKLAPKSKPDFAYIQHMLYHLDKKGTMAVILPHGILFRAAAEETIREYIVKEKNYLDTIIGLPANIFYGTSIPTIVLVFKKHRKNKKDILFIDASQNFEKVRSKNILRDKDINKIIDTYKNREEVPKFSHLATLKEIKNNDFKLNIARYVDVFEEEAIDLDELSQELIDIDRKVIAIDKEIKKYSDELGLEFNLL